MCIMQNTGSIVHLRLPAALVEALDRRADREQRSRANLAGLLLRTALDESATQRNEGEQPMSEKNVIGSAVSETTDYPVRDKFSLDALAQIDDTAARQAHYAAANAAAAHAWVGGQS